MKKGLKKVLSLVLATAMTISCLSFAGIYTSAASSYINKAGGWYESAYAEWNPIPGAEGYAAYVKEAGASDSTYVQLDNELIRTYPNNYRVDAVGLKAGSYVLKIVPVINGALNEGEAIVTDELSVSPYDRSGFTFSSESRFQTGPGAYNLDGTLKSNAKVFYVTKDTAKTITTDVVTSNKGATTTATGFQDIIDAYQKGYDTTPIAFRIVGTIEADDMDSFSSSAQGLQIKGKGSYSEMNITIEGIGEDAAVNGFGFICRNAGNVEFRNFGILSFMDDGISLDTDNTDIWIHNMDLFYGDAGSASDQAKGDGTIDVKGDSQYITISYTHFWDSGKSSLCGMTSESGPNYITYHHNWFDHSDSRHPRIRTMSVHIYNNYFDGNSKYGVGAAKDSEAFVESNYFNGCKHPMMSSLQGSDIMENTKTGVPDFSAKGTFSGENGGIIKAYDNYVVGSDADKFNGGVEPVYYDANDTKTNGKATQFDAYLASTRDEKVPSTVKALVGGKTYSNFDTSVDLGVDEANITPVMQVPSVVTSSSGRMNGGDFPTDRSIYSGLTVASNSDVDSAFKSDIVNYKTSLVSVGGMEAGSVITTEPTTEAPTTEPTSQATTEAPTTEPTSQATTEAPTTEPTTTEPTTSATPVDLGEPNVNSGSGISITYNSATDTWVLKDTSSSQAALLTIPVTQPITSGKVVVSGKATPSTASGKWAFVKVLGTFTDSSGEVITDEFAALATDSNKMLTLRTDSANYSESSVKIEANKTYDYEFVIDLDNKTVSLTVDGNTYTGHTTATEITGVGAITSVSGSRDVSVTTPYVAVVNDDVPTTEPTTESTTESTTEPTTETPVDPTPSGDKGDVNADDSVNFNDAILVLRSSAGTTSLTDEQKNVADMNEDGDINFNDAILILRKAANS